MLTLKKYTKSISGAILDADIGLNPQPSPTSPQQLIVPIPQPTKESRQRLAESVGPIAEKAKEDVRKIRHHTIKHFQAVKKGASKDSIAHELKNIEKMVKSTTESIDQHLQSARQTILKQ